MFMQSKSTILNANFLKLPFSVQSFQTFFAKIIKRHIAATPPTATSLLRTFTYTCMCLRVQGVVQR